MSFLDPYEKNRRLSLIVILRLGVLLAVLALGLAGWWVWKLVV